MFFGFRGFCVLLWLLAVVVALAFRVLSCITARIVLATHSKPALHNP